MIYALHLLSKWCFSTVFTWLEMHSQVIACFLPPPASASSHDNLHSSDYTDLYVPFKCNRSLFHCLIHNVCQYWKLLWLQMEIIQLQTMNHMTQIANDANVNCSVSNKIKHCRYVYWLQHPSNQLENLSNTVIYNDMVSNQPKKTRHF